MKFKLDPTKQFTLFLTIVSALAIGLKFDEQLLLHLVMTLGFGTVLFWFYSNFSSKKKSIWNTIATCLIIFLVLDPGAAFSDGLYPMLATFLAVTWKYFGGWKKSPVVNPAVAGLLLASGIFALIPNFDPAFVSWWGASFNEPLMVILLIGWMLFGLKKWCKWTTVLTFLAAHAVILLVRGMEPAFLEFTYTTGTIYFLAAVMLIDPKTSPIAMKQQFMYGLLAALAYNSLQHAGAPHTALFAIAAANLGCTMMKSSAKKKKKAKIVTIKA